MKGRICIVTPDLMGPVACGGVGTAVYSMAALLARRRFDVTVLYAGSLSLRQGDPSETWREFYSGLGIRLETLPPPSMRIEVGVLQKASYEVYQWLKKRDFDTVHFPEWLGLGYYALLAKRTGVALQKTHLVVQVHGPTLWHREGSLDLPRSWRDFESDFLERKSVELADEVLLPSSAIQRWVEDRNWRLPADSRLMPNPVPPGSRRKTAGAGEIREVVFFGRLETRKGLPLFCEAVERLPSDILARYRFTFLGKDGEAGGGSGADFAKSRFESFGIECRILTEADSLMALDYLLAGGKLAVMPSLQENLPYSVIECQALGIPFVATEAGGIPELLHPEDRESCLVPARADALAAAILRSLDQPLCPRPARAANEIEDQWEALVAGGLGKRCPEGSPHRPDERSSFVSVCIPHRGRPDLLGQALASLQDQSCKEFEVVVVDDNPAGAGSPGAAALTEMLQNYSLDLRVLKGTGSGPGAARNLAARHAKGSHLLFMDDDNCAKPEEIATFQRALEGTGADILTCGSDCFSALTPPPRRGTPLYRWIPLGACRPLGMIRNVYGDMNFLISRSLFQELGGLREDPLFGEDWEFLGRAAAAGKSIEVIPEALFWYRKHSGNRSRFLQDSPKARYEALIQPMTRNQTSEFAPAFMLGLQAHEEPPSGDLAERFPDRVLVHRASFGPSEGDFTEFRPVRDVAMVPGPKGLAIRPKGRDPGFLLPLVDFPPESQPVLLLGFFAADSARLQLFYRTTEGPEFMETQSVRRSITAGWNRLRVEILATGVIGRIRIDLDGTESPVILSQVRVLHLGSLEEFQPACPPDPGIDLPKGGDTLSWFGEPCSPTALVYHNCQPRVRAGALEIEAGSNDPVILLPPMREAVRGPFQFHIDISSPGTSELQLFYLPLDLTGFIENFSIRRLLKPGRNRLSVVIRCHKPIRGFRLDPGNLAGKYQIHSLVAAFGSPEPSYGMREPFRDIQTLTASP